MQSLRHEARQWHPTTDGHNLQTAQQSDTSSFASYPLETTVESLPEALAIRLQNVHGRPAALISGGSLSGYAAALTLAKCGFSVVVVEKRAAYSRQTVLALKEEAVFSLANLAPDGALVNMLINEKWLVPCKHKIGLIDEKMAVTVEKTYRLFSWLIPHSVLPISIPQRTRPVENDQGHLALAGSDIPVPRHRNRLDYLDPTWPEHEPIHAVPAADWALDNPSRLSEGVFAYTRIMDLETALNRYCVRQPHITVLRGTVALIRTASACSPSYRPMLMTDGDVPSQAIPFPRSFALMCLAEGCHSVNRRVFGDIPHSLPVKETCQQRVYVNRFPKKRAATLQGVHIAHLETGPIPRISVLMYLAHAQHARINALSCTAIDTADDEETDAVLLDRACLPLASIGCSPLLNAQTRVYASTPFSVSLHYAGTPICGNIVLVGDTAVSGSPVLGAGASLALSHYPAALRNLVAHPLFGVDHPSAREAVESTYRRNVADIADIHHNQARVLMRRQGFYSPNTGRKIIAALAHARFDIRASSAIIARPHYHVSEYREFPNTPHRQLPGQ